MAQAQAPRMLIAATSSGAGKTTMTCGLLRAFARRGLSLRAFKCGPDYLDPQFHREVLGIASLNLDLFLAGPDLVRELVATGGHEADLCLIEGAMGYYDGIAQGLDASAYDVARQTRTPVVLVVDARGRALSAAAEVAGFLHFREPSYVAGVILNRVSESYAPRLANMVQSHTGVPVLGFVPQLDEARLASRHLGLVSASEVDGLLAGMDALADVLERTVDLDALVALARGAEPLSPRPRTLPAPCQGSPTIAVARDEAFSFYYEDSLALLERLGARLAYFSPLHDASLPEGACGLYLGGGYPELHAQALSENVHMRQAVRDAVGSGMPTIAECGGFLYLHEELEDADGRLWPLAGAICGCARGQGHLVRFGYATLEARRESLLAPKGGRLAAHEFHYWDTTHPGDAFCARKPQSARSWNCVVGTPTLYAGFPHLYLNGAPDAAKRFVDACAAFGEVR